jgi:hypothetical protein
VLNAKGGEIQAKATGSATTCDFFKKNSEGVFAFCDQNPPTSKLLSCGDSLVGEKFDYGKKGEFCDSCSKHVLKNIFGLSKQSIFDIKVRK